jgi:MFS family permease
MVVVLVVVVVVLLLTGFHEQSVWTHYLGRPCKGGFPAGHAQYCEQAVDRVATAARYNAVIALAAVALGPLCGAVLGVVAVAQEIERHTVRLAWTQSRSREKWLASSLLVNLLLLGALFVPLCLVTSWWNRAAHFAPRVHLNGLPISGFSILFMSILSFVMVGILGMFVRRSGWTFALGLVIAVVCIYAVEIDVRPNLVPTTFTKTGTTSVKIGSASGFYGTNSVPSNAWEKSNGIALVGSRSAPSEALMQTLTRRLNSCYASPLPKGKNGSTYCIDKSDVEFFALYVPDSEYWTVEVREGSIYAGVVLLLAGFGFLTVRRMRA